ncbi:porin [Methylomonas lenta]|uniref:Porin n=1 Tax=Methylomonas lenta TaxID=980561 RepID=A0A177NUX6_9GAMM|nr:porin [Methylomonas lenta]OAI20900.1 porin [Methylomonas lenta]
MKLTKLSLAMASALGAGLAADALAMDLYVDTKTQQIFAEPGRGRVLLGEFQKVGDTSSQPADSANLKAEIDEIKQDLALKNNELKALDEHMKVAEEVKVKLDSKGVQFETADKDFKFRLGGRIHTDATFSGGDHDLVNAKGNTVGADDGTEIRRARMEMLGTFYQDWDFKSQFDFADNKVAVKDLFVQYSGLKDLEITAGQQKQAFSRELQESSNDMLFMERSLMNALNEPTVDRAIGLDVGSFQKDWTAQVGVFGDTVTPNNTNNIGQEGWAISSRATYAPINEKTKVIHLGVAGNYRDPSANGEVNGHNLQLRSETTHMSNLYLIDTGAISNVSSIKMAGLEATGLYGPFTVGGEYTHMWLDRENGSQNAEFDGWYTEAAWTITGESRKYKKGKFYKVEPKNNFSFKNGTWGAWELATRYSQADLNSGIIHGGEMSNITVALNWYLNDNIRFMADYNKFFSLTNTPITTVGGGEPNVDVFMLRSQLAF